MKTIIMFLPTRLWHNFRDDSLFRNSIYLMMSTGVMAALGFVFWILVARIFPTKDVGIATTLISIMALLNSFSLLGLDTSLIRYLPKSTKRSEKINSVIFIVITASIISTLIFVVGLHIFSPKLIFLQTKLLYIITFGIFVIGTSINTLFDSIFMAYRSSGNVLIKNSFMSVLKLLFPLFFIFLGSYGIFASVSLATLISALIGLGILMFKYNYKPSLIFSPREIKEMAIFSGGNYIAGFLSQAPSLILPLIIINRLNAETAAYFYIDMMILGFLAIISGATTQSLLAEGAYDETQLKTHFLKAIKTVFIFLIPAIILIALFGNIILHAFGKNYAKDAFLFLQIISISAVFMSISALGRSALRLRHQMKTLVMLSILNIPLVLGLPYLFINKGLVGVGYGWLLGQALLSVLYTLIFGKEFLSLKSQKNTQH